MSKRKELKAKDMTNSELKIKMAELEKSYEKAKNEVIKRIQEMERLDGEYSKIKEELKKRKMF